MCKINAMVKGNDFIKPLLYASDTAVLAHFTGVETEVQRSSLPWVHGARSSLSTWSKSTASGTQQSGLKSTF
jgi:hypothetical protein